MSREYEVENQERKSLAEGIHVGALCRVENFDPSAMTVNVQPLSKVLDAGMYRTPPQVLGVPVALIRGGGFVLRPWYAKGDVGVLLYIDHDIDRIAEAGQECQPNTERNHSGDDAMFSDEFDITQDMLEAYIGRNADAFTVNSITRLGNVYNALKDGTQSVEDFKRSIAPAKNGKKASKEPEPVPAPAEDKPEAGQMGLDEL